MKPLLLLIVLFATNLYADPIMIVPGKLVLAKTFESPSEIDKKTIRFNKETQYQLKHGALHALPPVVAYKGTEKNSKWAKSSFSRVNFPDLPKDYICQFRWKYLKPENSKLLTKGLVYIDLGHRCIRTTINRDGVKLMLSNHLLGKDAGIDSKVLHQTDALRLEHDKWYEITAEVKGTEVVIQIGDQILYGQNELIASERAQTVNIDSLGEGYLLDEISIWEAGDYQPSWPQRSKTLHHPQPQQ